MFNNNTPSNDTQFIINAQFDGSSIFSPSLDTFPLTPPPFLVPHPISQTDWESKINLTNTLVEQVDKKARTYFSIAGGLSLAFFLVSSAIGVVEAAFVVVFVSMMLCFCRILQLYKASNAEIEHSFDSWAAFGIKVTYAARRNTQTAAIPHLIVDFTGFAQANPGMLKPQPMQPMQPLQPMQQQQQQQPPLGYAPNTNSSPQAPPSKPQVQVLVPSYGGGGPSMVEWHGTYISVDIPKDAVSDSTIMIDVPERYLEGGV